MATAISKARCATCNKQRSTSKCAGCSQDFCYKHLTDHYLILSQQLDEIEVHRDLFRQTLTQQTTNPPEHPLIKQIDQWERDSISKIQQTAQESRQILLQHTTAHINQIEIDLAQLTDQMREIRQENDVNEIDLTYLGEKLTQLEKELDHPSNISIEQDCASLINKISVVISKELFTPHTGFTKKWSQNAITVAGGNRGGNQLNQLSNPIGICVDDDDQCMYIADHQNHRIVKWKNDEKNGQIVAGGNEAGNRTDQLNGPTDVLVDKRNDSLIICDCENKRVVRWPRRNGKNGQIIISDIDCCRLTMDDDGDLYVSDRNKHEVRRWKIGEVNGTIVAGGNGKGSHLNQLNNPTFIFVDQDHSVYVSDWKNHRVMKWMKGAEEGIVVAGGQREGHGLTQLSYPQGVIVDRLSHVYVADSSNRRITRWSIGSEEGCIVVGENGQGQQPIELNNPLGLSFDRQSNLYVVDHTNNRVQKFHVDST